MAPQSRGDQIPPGLQSKSTPDLSTLHTLDTNSSNPLTPTIRTLAASPIEDLNENEDGRFNNASRNEADPPFRRGSSSSTSSDDSESLNLPTTRSFDAQTSRSHSHSHLPLQANPAALYPPFYNRPPTPLPPSPSLTSLFRPHLSISSHPSTPDSSDIDVSNTSPPSDPVDPNSSPTSAATALNRTARTATAVPRASPKVPTYEYYGFTLYMASSAAFLIYILWAYLPSAALHRLGITYYPDRWWALAIPAWLVMLIVYIFVALASYNTGYLTLPMQSCENMVDELGAIAVVDRATGQLVKKVKGPEKVQENLGGGGAMRNGRRVKNGSGGGSGSSGIGAKERDKRQGQADEDLGRYRFSVGEAVDWKGFWNIGTDGVMDVPIGGVCEVLYGAGREEYGDDDDDDDDEIIRL